MFLCSILGIVAVAEGLGGAASALLIDRGFIRAATVRVDGLSIIRPGIIRNTSLILTVVAAALHSRVYGPFNVAAIISPPLGAPPVIPSLTVSSVAGAALVGVVGTRRLANEVDKSLLKVAASQAASAPPSGPSAQQILLLSKAAAILNMVRTMRGNT